MNASVMRVGRSREALIVLFEKLAVNPKKVE
jgi:hypothetical protein